MLRRWRGILRLRHGREPRPRSRRWPPRTAPSPSGSGAPSWTCPSRSPQPGRRTRQGLSPGSPARARRCPAVHLGDVVESDHYLSRDGFAGRRATADLVSKSPLQGLNRPRGDHSNNRGRYQPPGRRLSGMLGTLPLSTSCPSPVSTPVILSGKADPSIGILEPRPREQPVGQLQRHRGPGGLETLRLEDEGVSPQIQVPLARRRERLPEHRASDPTTTPSLATSTLLTGTRRLSRRGGRPPPPETSICKAPESGFLATTRPFFMVSQTSMSKGRGLCSPSRPARRRGPTSSTAMRPPENSPRAS